MRAARQASTSGHCYFFEYYERSRSLDYVIRPEIHHHSKDLVRTVADRIKVRPRLVPLPFALWRILASGVEVLPGSPLTRNQVALMQRDNIASADCPGLSSLDIAPTESKRSYLHSWTGLKDAIRGRLPAPPNPADRVAGAYQA